MFSSLLFFGVHAQNPGDFDGTFGTDGIVLTPIGTASGMAYDIAVQPDGKIIMAGKASIGTWKFALVRYNIDGTLDESFGDNGIVTTAIAHSDQGISVALQPDGKIVLGGATYDNVDYTGAVVRYFEDGDVDNTFGVDGVAHLSNISFIESLVLQDDGKIVVGAEKNNSFAMARLNADGSLDNSYGIDGYVNTEIYDIEGGLTLSYIQELVIQDDGKIVAAGFSYGNPTFHDVTVVRYLEDGTVDTNFADGGVFRTDLGGFADFCTAAAIQPDGKIILGGHKEISGTPGVPTYDAALIRLNSDGTLDSTFGTDGIVSHRLVTEATYVQSVAIQADGKIVFTGSVVTQGATSYHTYVCRLNADGTMDLSFADIGYRIIDPYSEDFSQSILVQDDGSILVAGYSAVPGSVYNFRLMKLIGQEASTPAVHVNLDDITTTTVEATFTPNNLCASYHALIMTYEDIQMWLGMMGSVENMIREWGIEKEETYTHNFTDLVPGTEYFIYTLAVDADGTEAPYDSTACHTLTQGGEGEASATIELFDITLNSVRMVVTPNAETAEFHNGLMTKSYFDEIGQEAAVAYFQNDEMPHYETDDWVWPDLESNTAYMAIATCMNALGEWGPPTIVEFTTTPVSVSGLDKSDLVIFPNPNQGEFKIVGENLQGAEVKVFDITGKQVYGQYINEDSFPVDISDRASGLYVIQILHKGEISTHKILKQ